MLILQRRIGESLRIGETIELHVLGRQGGQIKLGVAAPESVNIRRAELPAKVGGTTAEAVDHQPSTSAPGVYPESDKSRL